MVQKAITVVIDEFSDAVARLAQHAPPDVVEQLHRATADLLEAFGTAAQTQATQYAQLLRAKVDAQGVQQDAQQVQIDQLDARTERRATPRDES